jgi:hypothetical protein
LGHRPFNHHIQHSSFIEEYSSVYFISLSSLQHSPDTPLFSKLRAFSFRNSLSFCIDLLRIPLSPYCRVGPLHATATHVDRFCWPHLSGWASYTSGRPPKSLRPPLAAEEYNILFAININPFCACLVLYVSVFWTFAS